MLRVVYLHPFYSPCLQPLHVIERILENITRCPATVFDSPTACGPKCIQLPRRLRLRIIPIPITVNFVADHYTLHLLSSPL